MNSEPLGFNAVGVPPLRISVVCQTVLCRMSNGSLCRQSQPKTSVEKSFQCTLHFPTVLKIHFHTIFYLQTDCFDRSKFKMFIVDYFSTILLGKILWMFKINGKNGYVRKYFGKLFFFFCLSPDDHLKSLNTVHWHFWYASASKFSI